MDPSLRRYLASLAAAGVRWIPRAQAPVARAGAAPQADSGPPAPAEARPRGPAPTGRATAADATGPAPGRARPDERTSRGAPAPSATTPPRREGPPTARPPGATEARGGAPGGGAPGGAGRAARPTDPAAALAAVAAEVSTCEACKLCSGRQHAVPGEGHPDPRVLFIGEGPGAEEDRTGRPFVGPAGQLLDDIITKGMGLSRADVFIANVVKCRPPANRVPEPDEVAACRGYLERQIAALAPAVICTLGATATRALLDTDAPMGRLRGRQQMLGGIPVIPTYHPAYLLRNPAAKRPTWEDIQKVMELAGLR